MNKLTNEQLTELKNLKSIDELKEFLTKENITLTDEEIANTSQYFKTGKSELADDDLDMVTGGSDKNYDYEAEACADGRKVRIEGNTSFCSCVIEKVWAKSRNEKSQPIFAGNTIYTCYECKCYSCGRTQATHIYNSFIN
jgi:hypothetical protein